MYIYISCYQSVDIEYVQFTEHVNKAVKEGGEREKRGREGERQRETERETMALEPGGPFYLKVEVRTIARSKNSTRK